MTILRRLHSEHSNRFKLIFSLMIPVVLMEVEMIVAAVFPHVSPLDVLAFPPAWALAS